MRNLFRAPLSTAIAIIAGLVVLLGYFFDLPLLANLRDLFLRWFTVLAGVALLVGVANLATVHVRKVTGRQKEWVYSLVTLVALAVTLVLAGAFGPTSGWAQWIFNYIQVPIESSLMAVLTAVLILAVARLLRYRPTLFSLLFLITALIVLLGTAPILGVELPWLHGSDGLRALITRLPAAAGGRGLLLGIALGTIATGLRVLIGADRPYGGG